MGVMQRFPRDLYQSKSSHGSVSWTVFHFFNASAYRRIVELIRLLLTGGRFFKENLLLNLRQNIQQNDHRQPLIWQGDIQ